MKQIFNLLCLFLLFYTSVSKGQVLQFKYKRELSGINHKWHRIKLPDEIFGKTSSGLEDIRIIGVTNDLDTIEVPFILQVKKDRDKKKNINFKTINTSKIKDVYYFTFEIFSSESINQISLNFEQENFDWRVKLEGSNDQKSWFTIISDYRILSIFNESANYQFTKLKFADAKYQYYRLSLASQEPPKLTSAEISQTEFSDVTLKEYQIKNFIVEEKEDTKETEVDINLQMPIPINSIGFNISSPFDFYRPIKIMGLIDSTRTENGWKYNYKNLTTGTLNSLEKNEFSFNSTLVKKMKVLISNNDNQALKITGIGLKGYEHELVFRIDEDAQYFLFYGCGDAKRPSYDIEQFVSKIPPQLTLLNVGEEQLLNNKNITKKEPLFKRMTWLWGVMGLIILVIGWASVKMLSQN